MLVASVHVTIYSLTYAVKAIRYIHSHCRGEPVTTAFVLFLTADATLWEHLLCRHRYRRFRCPLDCIRTSCSQPTSQNKYQQTKKPNEHISCERELQRVSSYAVQKTMCQLAIRIWVFYFVSYKNMEELLIFDQFGIGKFVSTKWQRRRVSTKWYE